MAKPLLCLPFPSSTFIVPKSIKQRPWAWFLYYIRHTLDISTLFMDNRPHGVTTGDMSDFCSTVDQHHLVQLPSQAYQQATIGHIQDPGSHSEKKTNNTEETPRWQHR